MKKRASFSSLILVLLVFTGSAIADELQLVDAHIHYSHDAWEVLSPQEAVQILREAGLKKAMVSSSSDEGTQKLYRVAPDLVVPVLRPYRKRGELYSWMHDDSVTTMLTSKLAANRYAGIGEFHADGEQIDLPVLQRVIELAEQHQLFLHAHVNVEALHRIFKTNPDALVLWAHAGFESTDVIADILQIYPNLWADLSFRGELADEDQIEEQWRQLFIRFPTRFLLGSDTYTPQRWIYVAEHAEESRQWLSALPDELARNIACGNAESLLARTAFYVTNN